MRKPILLLCFICLGCTFERPTEFSKESLTEKIITLENEEVTIGEILNQYKGKKILIDIWASWCKDCIVGLPKLKQFQKDNPKVVYLFLSQDKNIKSWKRGINRFGIEGAHYFMPEKKDGAFGEFLNIWWIPRYVVLDESGKISLFKATKITDPRIVQALKK